MLIARVIADPETLETSLDTATAALGEAGLALAHAQLLENGGPDNRDRVLQLELPGAHERAQDDRAILHRILSQHFIPSDCLISDAAIRMPDLFVADMDSTMIGQECIDELADYAGLKDKIAAITERAMRGELAFEVALRERVGLLAGLEESAIARCLAERIVPTPGARVLVETLKHRGCRTVLVTGGFHHFADPVAEMIGFERVVANRLEVQGGALSGLLVGAISDAAVKARVLAEELAAFGADAVAMAAGDGANDAQMLAAAGYGIAVRAKPVARTAANGWVERGKLTALLELLDIPEKDWAGG